MDIKLDLESKDGIAGRHIPKDKFRHNTGAKIKLFPFTTKWSPTFYNDFVYFNGIMGECFRLVKGKRLPPEWAHEKNYNLKLKEIIIENAVEKAVPKEAEQFSNILGELMFQGENLFSFSKETLPYLSFKKDNATLREIAAFIFDLFFDDEILQAIQSINDTKLNLLYKLMLSSLPVLKDVPTKKKGYLVHDSHIIQLFKKDFIQLASDRDAFLQNIDKLLKYYFFFYTSQLALKLNDFFVPKNHEIYFTLESEVVSKTRHCFQFGWEYLKPNLDNIFSHANALELLNYVEFQGKEPKLYVDFKEAYNEMEKSERLELLDKIRMLEDFYKDKITKPSWGWEECTSQLHQKSSYRALTCPLEKSLYQFWFTVDFQFLNTARKKPYGDYKSWFTEFCRANFLKRRGRVGYTLRLSQDMLLFLTKLCIGNARKIRLKTLWGELGKRGIFFDEPSKEEVVRIFGKINLIEKKSDSGDAQYVRAIL